MPGLLFGEKVLSIVYAAALAGVIVKILSNGLQRVYPYFFCYLVAQGAQLAIPLIAGRMTNLYGYLFLATETVIVCFYILIVLELYSLVLRDLRGIATTSRRYVRGALGAAVVVSLLPLAFQQAPSGILPGYFTFERTLVLSLVIFVFLITAFLVYYPIPLNRNVIYYSIGYACYFSTKALALLLRNTGHESRFAIIATSVALLAGSTACLVFWAFALTREGEYKKMVLRPPGNQDHEEKLLSQLQAINASLIRARK